ncbi:MAG TPA: cytochrome d ubiquinol oxidase subunit II [Jatrophihabitantaceae bacterium]|nr:cytochrome d ubiquinol oxidase subunit II [Jatrophihabitantaceae bacterium]
MRYDIVLLAVMWAALTAYALLGGADFGAGIWDLLAGGSARGARPRSLIEHSIGPVWEANHVWLIFVLVLMWTAFPPLFAAISSTLYLLLTFIALGVIARGATFAFRKALHELWQRRLFGAMFAFSSLITPFFLGAVAGAIASGRVPPGLARGGALTSWLNPVSLLTGCFAVASCAYLAAAYLTADAWRAGELELVDYFRHRAMISALVVGGLSLVGLVVLHSGAPVLTGRLLGRALPLVLLASLAGLGSVLLAWQGRLVALRVAAATAVTGVLVAWGAAQYPSLLLPGLTVAEAAAPRATLAVTVYCVIGGLVVLLPSLGWLFVLFQRGGSPPSAARTCGISLPNGVDRP